MLFFILVWIFFWLTLVFFAANFSLIKVGTTSKFSNVRIMQSITIKDKSCFIYLFTNLFIYCVRGIMPWIKFIMIRCCDHQLDLSLNISHIKNSTVDNF